MKICYIVGAAPINKRWLKNIIPKDAFLIGVDGGFEQVKAVGKEPKIFVGDGDSSRIPDVGRILQFSTKKNTTDMEEAVKHALTLGFYELVLLGSTGGRLDHFFGNIALLEKINEFGKKGVLLDEQNKVTFHENEESIIHDSKEYIYVSIIPLDKQMVGVTTKGFVYPLSNETLYRNSTRSISNQLEGSVGSITSTGGAGLLIQSIDKRKISL